VSTHLGGLLRLLKQRVIQLAHHRHALDRHAEESCAAAARGSRRVPAVTPATARRYPAARYVPGVELLPGAHSLFSLMP